MEIFKEEEGGGVEITRGAAGRERWNCRIVCILLTTRMKALKKKNEGP